MEIRKSPGDGNVLGTWIGEGEGMKHRLVEAIPEHQMDLQWGHEEFSKVVFEGVKESGYLVYQENEPPAT